MYPNDTNYEYVYSSRKLCYSESGHYVNYVSEIMKKNKETLWVDIQGSGDSHVYFFSKHFGTVPPKIFFKQNKMQGRYSALAQEKRPSASSLDLSLYENNITSFKSPDWVVDIDGRDWSKGAFYLEALNRAPHPSIIELDAKGNPVYEQAPDYFDRNLEALLVAYEKILDNFWINDNINLRTDGSKYNVYKSDFNDGWNGLLALDIDGTITGDDFGLLEDLVNYSKDNKVKIIFITARWDPMISHRNGHLQDIMKYFEQQLDYPIDIWFNALSEKKSISYIAKTKVHQLEMARQELGLPKDRCMLVDDILVTVNLAQKSGFEHSTWVSTDEKIGINEDTMTNIKKMITDDTPVITDDQELENSSLEDQVSKVAEEKAVEQVTVKAENTPFDQSSDSLRSYQEVQNESPVVAPVTTSCKMSRRVDYSALDREEKIMIIAGGKALDHVFMKKERKPVSLNKNQLMFCYLIRSECTFSI